MLPRATENAMTGHIWHAGRYLPTPVLYSCYSSLCLIPRNRHSKHGSQVLCRPIKSTEWPIIEPRSITGSAHSVIGQITGFFIGIDFRVFIGQLWCKIHCTTEARATNTILYDYIPVIACSCTAKAYNTGLQQWCNWRGYKGANPPPDKLNAKIDPHFSYISIVSTFAVFSKLLFIAFFESFWTVVFRLFQVLLYRNPHRDTLLFLNFFLNVGERSPSVASGPLSATFPTLAQISTYATGLQLNFPE